jgi:uncharacterized delta-60 repeat protein
MRRRTVGFGLCVLLLLVGSAAAAGARRMGVDRSFGTDGVVRLDPLGSSGYIAQMAVGPDRGIYLLDFRHGCSETTCSADVSVARRSPDGSVDEAYGRNGVAAAFEGQQGSGAWYPALAVDSQGRAVVALAEAEGIFVARLEPDGRPDLSFGSSGKASIPCDCRGLVPSVRIDSQGRINIEGDRSASSGSTEGEESLAVRLTAAGSLDASFGGDGREAVTLPGIARFDGQLLRRDGSRVLVAFGPCCSAPPPPGFELVRIRSDWSVDRRFGRLSRRSLARLPLRPGQSYYISVGALIARAHGEIDLLGGTGGKGFVVRVRANGRLDRRFGKGGIRWLRWPIYRAIPTGDGRVFAIGREDPLETFLLNRAGRPIRSYARKGPVLIDDWKSFAGLELQGRRPLLFDGGAIACRQYCPPKPRLIRLAAPLPGHRHRR